MNISLKARHLVRYKEILALVLGYVRSDVAREMAHADFLTEDELAKIQTNGRPEQLADDLERMGPTFVKVGQLLSSRADLLPEAYLRGLARLQDKVKPFPYSDVEKIVQEELGVRVSKAFASFDPEPLAAASLGQVHRATLRDGREVVVKVQRPGIRKQCAEDFEVLEEIASFLDAHTKAGRRYQFRKVLDEFKTTLKHELDYRQEATNLRKMAESMKEFPDIEVPLPVQDYTTSSVLTMDFVQGTKVTKLSPLARMEFDGESLANELFRAYLKQVLIEGMFHADPHPGNIFLTDHNKIALLDLGMIGRTTPGMQEQLLKLLLAISEGDAEVALEMVLRVSETREDFNEGEFRRKAGKLVAEQKDSTLQQMDVGKALLDVGRVAAETGLYVPTELTMLGKTLLQLDQVGRILSPTFDPNAAVRRNVSETMRQRMFKDLSPAKLLGTALEVKDFLTGLPLRLNKILDAVANAELELKIKTPDTDHLMAGFQKVANRITTGLVLTALIIGAALLMQVPTSFRIFGYPGIAMLCFMVAAAGGLWLVLSIVIKDHKDKKNTRH
ncbi:MAG TPA: AarF/UbiB family protein [Verrucomicrobiae bacterium]|nr:AarF/UbiB family protein [Verrucomicrobiae bacterium]